MVWNTDGLFSIQRLATCARGRHDLRASGGEVQGAGQRAQEQTGASHSQGGPSMPSASAVLGSSSMALKVTHAPLSAAATACKFPFCRATYPRSEMLRLGGIINTVNCPIGKHGEPVSEQKRIYFRELRDDDLRPISERLDEWILPFVWIISR